MSAANHSDLGARDVEHCTGRSQIGAGAGDSAPTISVILPAYNAASYLAETVASIQAQTFSGWELIIVDDGATDGTGEQADRLAAEDNRIRVVHQCNNGVTAARNAGVDAATPGSAYIAFVDADDLWMPETLEVLLHAVNGCDEVAGAYGLGRYIDESGRPIPGEELESWQRSRLRLSRGGRSRLLCPVRDETTFEMLAVRNYIPAGSLLLRRADFERAGRFREGLRGAEDWHMWMRVVRNKPIRFVDHVLLSYRRHASNTSGDLWLMRREQFRAAKDLYETCDLSEDQRRQFLRSQPIACHLYWARDDVLRANIRGAASHIAVAWLNLWHYHIAPKLFPRAQVQSPESTD